MVSSDLPKFFSRQSFRAKIIVPSLQGSKLKAALSSKTELEAEVHRLAEEGQSIRKELMLKDFDLTRTSALKALLNDRLQDLERVIEAHDAVVRKFQQLG